MFQLTTGHRSAYLAFRHELYRDQLPVAQYRFLIGISIFCKPMVTKVVVESRIWFNSTKITPFMRDIARFFKQLPGSCGVRSGQEGAS